MLAALAGTAQLRAIVISSCVVKQHCHAGSVLQGTLVFSWCTTFCSFFIGLKYMNICTHNIYIICTSHGLSMLKYIFSYRIIFHFFHQCHRGVLGPHTSFKAEFATPMKETPPVRRITGTSSTNEMSGKQGGGETLQTRLLDRQLNLSYSSKING